MFEPIVKVETSLSPPAFLPFLREVAKRKVPDLYFKEVSSSNLYFKTIGELAFCNFGLFGRVWESEFNEQTGYYTISLAIFPIERLPKEVRKEIKALILRAVEIVSREFGLVKSFKLL